MPSTPTPDDRERTAYAFERAWVLTTRHVADLTAVSLTAGLTLGRLDRFGPTRLTALAVAEGVSQPSMSQVVQRLEKQGLTTRVTDPDDGRAALVDITDAGSTLLQTWSRDRCDRLSELLSALSDEDEATLTLAMRVALPIIERLISTAGDTLTRPAVAEPTEP